MEKRKDRRAPSNFQVEYRLEEADVIYTCQAIDISQSGIFLAINPPPPLETRLYLMFSLPGFAKLGPLKVIGRVVRIVPTGEGQAAGVGVTFDIIYADNRDAIKAFIRSILGPTLVARPSTTPRPAKPGAKFKLTFEGDTPALEESEADSEEDRKRLKSFKDFSGSGIGADPERAFSWMRFAGISIFVIIIVVALFQAGRCSGML